eukprot:5265123-Pleurochrysis_carterae.AAC.1
MPTRLSSLRPTSPLPAWIGCFLGSHATLALAAATVVRTFIGTPSTPSFRPSRSSSPPCKETRRSVHAIDLSAVLGFLRNQILFYRRRNPLCNRSLCLPLLPHLVLVCMRSSAVRQPQ